MRQSVREGVTANIYHTLHSPAVILVSLTRVCAVCAVSSRLVIVAMVMLVCRGGGRREEGYS